MERLMDRTVTRRTAQRVDGRALLVPLGAGQARDRQRDRPHTPATGVRAADAGRGPARVVVGIGVAEDEAPRRLVYGVTSIDVAKSGRGEQARHVGVVHESDTAL